MTRSIQIENQEETPSGPAQVPVTNIVRVYYFTSIVRVYTRMLFVYHFTNIVKVYSWMLFVYYFTNIVKVYTRMLRITQLALRARTHSILRDMIKSSRFALEHVTLEHVRTDGWWFSVSLRCRRRGQDRKERFESEGQWSRAKSSEPSQRCTRRTCWFECVEKNILHTVI